MDDFAQIDIRTIEKVFFAYNPSESNSWLYELPDDQTVNIHSTYKDNPFLEQSIINQLERLKDKDLAYYQIFCLGLRTTTKLNVYSHFNAIPHIPERFDKYVFGADFGYNHPTSIVKIWYYEDEIFIEPLIHESYLTAGQLVTRMEEKGVDKVTEILCDTARPEIIQELNNAGFQALKANKNVAKGIDLMKRTVVYYHEDDEYTRKEYENYKWQKKGDQILDEVVKLYDDIMDSTRYALMWIATYYR